MTQDMAPPSVPDLLASIARTMRADEGQQIVHVEMLEGAAPQYAHPSPPLPEALQRCLPPLGVTQLYTHQVAALDRVRSGANVVVVTATSSGKTLCYNLPIIESILNDRATRALYLYPTNALVNDQLKSLFRINLGLGRDAFSVARYTGSLDTTQRKAVRERNPNIVLTNPEMLHLSFLLWRDLWQELWSNLRYVVIDEIHTYRGVFGSNMAQLLRRVLRMAAHYGAAPQFVCCSATIANPGELAERLTGQPFDVVGHDGAGRQRRYFVLWNPPLQEGGREQRRSHTEEAVALLQQCVQARYNTIVFARARGLTERMLRLASGSDPADAHNDASRISAYRAGYLAEEREEIENRLKSGELHGVITTNALELGIDIGNLDAAIIAGYPGTIMSTWQQAGRAGRRHREALIVLVASQNPLDQYYMRHPQVFFAQSHELAIIDEDNPHIRLKHLLCAARELPLSQPELDAMPASLSSTLEGLRAADLLVPDERGQSWTVPKSPREVHFAVSLRAASHETFHILNEQRSEIGTIEPPSVYREAHPGAIYQHGEDSYRVTYLDERRHTVRVRTETLPHYTRASSTTLLQVEQEYSRRTLDIGGVPVEVALGDVLVRERIVGYQELTLASNEMVRRVNLDHPLSIVLHTTAMWLIMPTELRAALSPTVEPNGDDEPDQACDLFSAGLHAIEHLLTGVMPLLVMCDRRDVDGYHHAQHPDLGAPALFVYDAYEGGIGLAEIAFQRADELLQLALETVTRCECRVGCPACIQSGACRLRNESLHKRAAEALLRALTTPQAVTSTGVSDAAGPRPALLTAKPPSDPRSLGRQRALRDILEYTRQQTVYQHVSAETTPLSPPTPSGPAEAPDFAVGDWVELAPYGRGQVQHVHATDERQVVVVRFVNRGVVRELDPAKSHLRPARS